MDLGRTFVYRMGAGGRQMSYLAEPRKVSLLGLRAAEEVHHCTAPDAQTPASPLSGLGYPDAERRPEL